MSKQIVENDNCQVCLTEWTQESDWEGCLHNIIRLTNVNKTNVFRVLFFFRWNDERLGRSVEKDKTNKKNQKERERRKIFFVNQRKMVLLIYL